MVKSWIASFPIPDSEERLGDCQVFFDTENGYCLVIDGGCGNQVTRLIAYLKANGFKKVYLLLTHPHYDHGHGLRKVIADSYFDVVKFYCYDPKTLEGGLRNNKGSNAVREDIDYLKKIINEAKNCGAEVVYLKNGDKVELGDIKFNVYRKQPTVVEDDDDNGWAYVNDGSLCMYFPYFYYWTSGDGPMSIAEVCAANNVKPVFFKIPHHGNNCNRSECNGLKPLGAKFCWYNDLEPNGIGTTDFTAYGARRCKEAGFTVLNCIGSDILITFGGGKCTITKGTSKWTYDIPYNKTGKEGWVKNAKGWWYKYADGSWAVGWTKKKWSKEKVNGSWFYFGEDGYMKVGWLWDTSRKCWFYLDPTTGAMWENSWLTYKGKKCWLKPSGRAAMNETLTLDGKTYYFDNNCYATEVTGETITTVTGKLNNLNTTRKQFVLDIANNIRKYAPLYGIKVYSPIIAQAIHESGWGESKLSANYHNYFGLKCGTKWTGKSVNMATQEEYSAGTLTNITANFRAYDSLEEGVKGYFEFIQLARYSNLKGVTDPQTYLENIKNDGYATGSQYVTHNMTLISEYSLTQFDVPVTTTSANTSTTSSASTATSTAKTTANPVDVMIQIMDAELGYHEGANNHTKYGDEMHKIQPSNMDANAAWCDCWFDWCVLQLCKAFGYDADMAREVLCGDFDDYTYSSVNLYKGQGRWFSTPQKGDQIFFGGVGHTGGVVDVKNGEVYTDEGNKSDQVKRCVYKIGDSRIIGYGRPRYELLNGTLTAENMPLIKKGAGGYFVLQLQKMLNSKSYSGKSTLEEDGSFGALTEAQVLAFQKSAFPNDKTQWDGEVGINTWTALFK